MKRLCLGVAILSVFAFAACGSSGPSAAEKKQAAEQRAKARAVALAEECSGQLGSFLSALDELDSRLTIGLSYEEYLTEVGDVSVVYGKIPINKLKPMCLGTAGVTSEKVLTKYSHAAEIWQDCFDELSCEIDSIDPELQTDWSAATRLLREAQTALRLMREPQT